MANFGEVLDNQQALAIETDNKLREMGINGQNPIINANPALIGTPEGNFDNIVGSYNPAAGIEEARRSYPTPSRIPPVLPDDYDPGFADRRLSEFADVNEENASQFLQTNDLQKAVRDKLLSIKEKNFETQLGVDQLTRTAMETNNILNYIIWLIQGLTVDIETINKLLVQYKKLIDTLRSDDATKNEFQKVTQDYNELLTSYKEVIDILNNFEVDDIDLNELRKVLNTNKLSSEIILEKLNQSITKMKDTSAEPLSVTQISTDEDESVGKFNEQLFFSKDLLNRAIQEKTGNDTNIDNFTLPDSDAAGVPYLSAKSATENAYQEKRSEILSIIEGLKITKDILNRPDDDAEKVELQQNFDPANMDQVISNIDEIIKELQETLYSSGEEDDEGDEPFVGGDKNAGKGLVLSGATKTVGTYLKYKGRKDVLDVLKKTPKDNFMNKLNDFRPDPIVQKEELNILKMRKNTFKKLYDINFTDFKTNETDEKKALDKMSELTRKLLSAPDDAKDSVELWNSRSKTVKDFVSMAETLGPIPDEEKPKVGNAMVALLEEIKNSKAAMAQPDDVASEEKNDLIQAKLYMPLIVNVLKEKYSIKKYINTASKSVLKQATLAMNLLPLAKYVINKRKTTNDPELEKAMDDGSEPGSVQSPMAPRSDRSSPRPAMRRGLSDLTPPTPKSPPPPGTGAPPPTDEAYTPVGSAEIEARTLREAENKRAQQMQAAMVGPRAFAKAEQQIKESDPSRIASALQSMEKQSAVDGPRLGPQPQIIDQSTESSGKQESPRRGFFSFGRKGRGTDGKTKKKKSTRSKDKGKSEKLKGGRKRTKKRKN
jgi:hypothetical protein